MKTIKSKSSLALAFALTSGIVSAHNVIPNAGFETDTVVPDGNFAVNEGSTANWEGGILTCGNGKTFCQPYMYEGSYGMALHKEYPQLSTRFTVAVGGTYDLSFMCVSRLTSDESQRCGMTVAVYFDDSTTAAATICPSSCSSWDLCRTVVNLSAGAHEIRFVGTLNQGIVDASTVLDQICLDLKGVNLVPNHSFENGTKLKSAQGTYNDPANPATFDWQGGTIVPGNTWKCLPKMADGMYGLSLDHTYHEASCSVTAPSDGFYQLAFRCLCARDQTGAAISVSVLFDDSATPVLTATPNAEWRWLDSQASVYLTAGTHTLRLSVPASGAATDRSTTIDFVSLVSQGSNIVPNPSFEVGPTCADLDVNDTATPWKGGIVTQGGSGKSMCKIAMPDGKYGVALHKEYPSTTADVQVPQDGDYLFSFKYTSRFQYCAMSARVVFDNAETPVILVRPSSNASWDQTEILLHMTAGKHTLTFYGDLDTSIYADDSVVIDDIRMTLQPFGVLQQSDLPESLQSAGVTLPSVFVDENDALSLKASRKFDAGTVYAATGAVVRTSGVEYRTAGETCCVTQDASVVTVDWQYAVIATPETNLIPNPGFETGTVLPAVGYAVNDPLSPVTDDWQGGIITRGWTTFCKADPYEGSYGLALHPSYPSSQVEFTTSSYGKYELSFAVLARDEIERTGKMSVSVYLDDELLMTVTPDSPAYWHEYVSTIRIKQAGNHTLRFTGTASVDSSANIDGIVLRALPQKGLIFVIK